MKLTDEDRAAVQTCLDGWQPSDFAYDIYRAGLLAGMERAKRISQGIKNCWDCTEAISAAMKEGK